MTPLAARLGRHPATAGPDGDLLTRFAAAGDEAAFAELVRRHGPLVWAAARRRLPDPADAADVFQATFLVLARKGPHLAGHPTVGPWLYRVAALTARNLRRRNAVRTARPLPPDLAVPPADPGLRLDLDDALLSLRERDRAAVVLCHLQGYTRREAAERLGVPEGTLSAVLHRALGKLRARLGGDPRLAVGGAAPAGLAAGACQAAAVVRVASLSAAGGPAVVSHTRGALRMFWLKKLLAGGMAAAACLGVGVGVGLTPRPAAVAAADPPAKPVPAEQEVERLKRLAEEAVCQEAEARKRAADLLAAVTRAEQRGPVIRLAVTAEERPFGAFVTLTETDAAGRVVAEYGCGGGKLGEVSLATHLRRARLDPAGARAVVMEVSPRFAPSDLVVVAQAVVDGGFPTVIYTGPKVERDRMQVRLDKLQPLVVAGQVKGERVELAKVLPLNTPAVAVTVRVQQPGGDDARVSASLAADRATVLAALRSLDAKLFAAVKGGGPLARPDLWHVEVRSPANGGSHVLVDVGTALKDPASDFQLSPGDRLLVMPSGK